VSDDSTHGRAADGDQAKAESDAAAAAPVSGESDSQARVKGATAEGESAPDAGTRPEKVTGGSAAVSTAQTDAAEDRAEVEHVAAGDAEAVSTEPGAEVLEVRHGMFGVKGTGDTSGYGGLAKTIEFPGPAQQPFGGWWDATYERIGELMPNSGDVITKVVIHRGEITFHVARAALPALVRHLRDDPHLRFEFLSGVSGVHYPADRGRELHAVYHLQSMTYNRRIRLEVSVSDADPHIPSVVATYPTADWHERETYDMFGLVFDGHPALTRVLMPDDWPGHPQRKDYPLGGIDVEYHGATVPPPDQRRTYS
jgi:NADH-quinone oxidoreductase subunit C